VLFSRTTEYALQALIFLASRDAGTPSLARDVAAYLDVPAPYLAKILRDLTHGGLVHSVKGRGGGFTLAPQAAGLTLAHVLRKLDGPRAFDGCLLGLKRCSDATACPVHRTWKPLKGRLVEMLEAKTLGSMGAEVRAGRYRLRLGPTVT
jgi:Rrf2 family protein